uniref:BTB domain-containing protein n=1 Tax=Panagrolaimus sp. ES5 TaxID=591445 RepID=A0AC34FE34_9BILA
MSILTENTTPLYGFKIKGDIDKFLLCKNKIYFTKQKVVDGMPDIKWSLKFSLHPICISMHLEIDSKEEIEWMADYIFDDKGTRRGSSTGIEKIMLGNFPIENLFVPSNVHYRKQDKIAFKVEAAFYLKSSKSNIAKICNPSEWGLRLQQNSEEDFDFDFGGEIIKIHKFMVAAESPVFKKMFEDNFKEAAEKKVTITDFKIHIIKAFVDYCYGRDITIENDEDEINLLYFADKYDCKTLKANHFFGF